MSNMSGFNWVTTSVINTMTDYKGGHLVEGTDGDVLLRAWGITDDPDAKNFAESIAEDGTADKANGVCVAHVGNFFKDNSKFGGKVCRIQKALPISAKMASVSLNFGPIAKALKNPMDLSEDKHPVHFYRLFIYVGIEPRAGEPFYYSNSYSLKGLPFSVDFTVKNSDNIDAAAIADNVYRLIKKNKIFVLDTEQVKVKKDGTKLIFTCVDSMQRIRAISIKGFGPWDEYRYPINELHDKDIKWNQDGTVDKNGILLDDPDSYAAFDTDDIQKGLSEFGTYKHLINDLRLPTIENRRWASPTEIEQPIPGAKYTQYIITMAAPANNGGVQAVGERMISETTHVFWVLGDAKEDADSPAGKFDALLTSVFGKLTTDVWTKKDVESGVPGTVYDIANA